MKRPEVILNAQFASKFAATNSTELLVQDKGITEIGSELQVFTHLRKLDIAFNPVTKLERLEQLPKLTHLAAYSCLLDDIEYLHEVPRLQVLLLQQNNLTALPRAMEYMKKLTELRLDRNKITCIEYMSNCTALQVLNLAHNNIRSIDGVAGLQSLQELKVNNNCLTTLKGVRALPSLMELDVSNNLLVTLDGLQHLPTLQLLHAENNLITTVSIPQTYSRQGVKLKSANGAAAGAGAGGKAGAAADAQSVASSKTGGKAASASSKAGNKRGAAAADAKGGKGTTAGDNDADSVGGDSHSAVTAASGAEAVMVLGMPHLTDIFLSGNSLTNLEGLDRLGSSIEVLDVRDNKIVEIDDILKHITRLKHLSELCIEGNPLTTMSLLKESAKAQSGKNAAAKKTPSGGAKDTAAAKEAAEAMEAEKVAAERAKFASYWQSMLTPMMNNGMLRRLRSIDSYSIQVARVEVDAAEAGDRVNNENANNSSGNSAGGKRQDSAGGGKKKGSAVSVSRQGSGVADEAAEVTLSVAYNAPVSSYNTRMLPEGEEPPPSTAPGMAKGQRGQQAAGDDGLFHTWDDNSMGLAGKTPAKTDNASTADGSKGGGPKVKKLEVTLVSKNKDKPPKPEKASKKNRDKGDDTDEDSDSGDEGVQYQAGSDAPTLSLKHVKTPEEIASIEGAIKALLRKSRDTMHTTVIEEIPKLEADIERAQSEIYQRITEIARENSGLSKLQPTEQDLAKISEFLPPPVAPALAQRPGSSSGRAASAQGNNRVSGVLHNADGTVRTTSGHLQLPRPPIQASKTVTFDLSTPMAVVDTYYANIGTGDVEVDPAQKQTLAQLQKAYEMKATSAARLPVPTQPPSVLGVLADEAAEMQRPLSRGVVSRQKSASAAPVLGKPKTPEEAKTTAEPQEVPAEEKFTFLRPKTAEAERPKTPPVAAAKPPEPAAVPPAPAPAVAPASKKFAGNIGFDARGGGAKTTAVAATKSKPTAAASPAGKEKAPGPGPFKVSSSVARPKPGVAATTGEAVHVSPSKASRKPKVESDIRGAAATTTESAKKDSSSTTSATEALAAMLEHQQAMAALMTSRPTTVNSNDPLGRSAKRTKSGNDVLSSTRGAGSASGSPPMSPNPGGRSSLLSGSGFRDDTGMGTEGGTGATGGRNRRGSASKVLDILARENGNASRQGARGGHNSESVLRSFNVPSDAKKSIQDNDYENNLHLLLSTPRYGDKKGKSKGTGEGAGADGDDDDNSTGGGAFTSSAGDDGEDADVARGEGANELEQEMLLLLQEYEAKLSTAIEHDKQAEAEGEGGDNDDDSVDMAQMKYDVDALVSCNVVDDDDGEEDDDEDDGSVGVEA